MSQHAVEILFRLQYIMVNIACRETFSAFEYLNTEYLCPLSYGILYSAAHKCIRHLNYGVMMATAFLGIKR